MRCLKITSQGVEVHDAKRSSSHQNDSVVVELTIKVSSGCWHLNLFHDFLSIKFNDVIYDRPSNWFLKLNQTRMFNPNNKDVERFFVRHWCVFRWLSTHLNLSNSIRSIKRMGRRRKHHQNEATPRHIYNCFQSIIETRARRNRNYRKRSKRKLNKI